MRQRKHVSGENGKHKDPEAGSHLTGRDEWPGRGWRSSHYCVVGKSTGFGARLSGFKFQLSHFLFDLRQITSSLFVSSFLICKMVSQIHSFTVTAETDSWANEGVLLGEICNEVKKQKPKKPRIQQGKKRFQKLSLSLTLWDTAVWIGPQRVSCPEVKDWAINVPISGSRYYLQQGRRGG